MESDSKDRIIVLGGVPNKSLWLNNGKPTIREQDFVIWEGGVVMAIPSSYFRHPYKILICKER